MDREGQRAEYAAWLRAAAEQRFGAARAQELAQTIEDVAGWMLEVATFPVAADEPPAFYAEPEPSS
jgi:hypothetical protein